MVATEHPVASLLLAILIVMGKGRIPDDLVEQESATGDVVGPARSQLQIASPTRTTI